VPKAILAKGSPPLAPLPPIAPTEPQPEVRLGCTDNHVFDAAARENMRTLSTLPWAPFRRPERGWEIYAPLIAHEVGGLCGPTSSGFAAALARWQQAQGAPADGVFRASDFMVMKGAWQGKRRFTRMRGVCPAPPPEFSMPWARRDEGYSGKPVQMRPRVLAAYREMVAAARLEVPEIAKDSQMLSIFSAYRSPDYDAMRCTRDGNCNGIVRATCSPHRTGLALDLNLGSAPGFGVDSSADANRLYQTRTQAYLWLVNNADRFGFANYPFEPWHWEWTGEAP